jgi:hypothetical protein|tara:strand:+ start:958 stop:1398 length:441 start_codon:yes stop_codon:yes gene_type:complete
MARREDILVEITELLRSQRSVRLGKVERDPIDPDQLAKTAFPAVYIETTDEEIDDLTMSMGAGGLIRKGMMEVNVVLIVGGRERDTQRNIAVEAIENTLMADRSLEGTVEDIRLTRVESVTTGESAPFASCRMVFLTEYCYQLNQT